MNNDNKILETPYNPKQHVEYRDGKKITMNNGNKVLETPYNPKQHVEYKDGEKVITTYNLKDLCIFCGKNPMKIQNKEDFLGLIKKRALYCPNCGVEFEINNDKYKLINLKDKNNNIWVKYHGKNLCGEEWLNIINDGHYNENNLKSENNKFCPKCGALVSSNAIFCGKCGGKLEEYNIESESFNISFYNNISSLQTYEKEIHELESQYQSKEKIALEIIEKRFTPPQLTYDRFIGMINNCNQIFYKQLKSATDIIEVATKHVPKVDDELKKRLDTLKSLIKKLDDLIAELIINSDDQSYSNEVKDLLEEMQDLVDSIKEYH
ncbi:MAG: zinc ribbon domain-containing protein [Methanobrevibacter sp.]|jgi:predicted amidophosphoribosyltransferase|nr:zinc ribbon domain-containing protein [Candidatus Methanovirga meridionalis]